MAPFAAVESITVDHCRHICEVAAVAAFCKLDASAASPCCSGEAWLYCAQPCFPEFSDSSPAGRQQTGAEAIEAP